MSEREGSQEPTVEDIHEEIMVQVHSSNSNVRTEPLGDRSAQELAQSYPTDVVSFTIYVRKKAVISHRGDRFTLVSPEGDKYNPIEYYIDAVRIPIVEATDRPMEEMEHMRDFIASGQTHGLKLRNGRFIGEPITPYQIVSSTPEEPPAIGGPLVEILE